jgi:hypothetical protein
MANVCTCGQITCICHLQFLKVARQSFSEELHPSFSGELPGKFQYGQWNLHNLPAPTCSITSTSAKIDLRLGISPHLVNGRMLIAMCCTATPSITALCCTMAKSSTASHHATAPRIAGLCCSRALELPVLLRSNRGRTIVLYRAPINTGSKSVSQSSFVCLHFKSMNASPESKRGSTNVK